MKAYIPNPSSPTHHRKPVHLVTDRALRYRANHPSVRPPKPRICAWCGSRRNVEVHHVNGHEEDTATENLAWACRSCNTKMGVIMKKARLGRRTRQFNPKAGAGARSLGQWLTAVMATKGLSDAMSVSDAVAMIRATSPDARSEFAHEIWSRRRRKSTDKQVPF